jgi:hypothetical protein
MNVAIGQSRTNIIIRILLISNSILLYDISSSGCLSLVAGDTSICLWFKESYNLR